MVINQYDIFWIHLDPIQGSEIKKKRPCVVISPNEMNCSLNTILIAPMTSTSKSYPTRVEVVLEKRTGWIALDQIRCVDRSRLASHAGKLEIGAIREVKQVLREMLID